MFNTRIITCALAIAGVLLIGSQAMAQAGAPGGPGVNVINTPLSVTVTNPTVPPSSVTVGNAAALAAANAQALRGTPVAFFGTTVVLEGSTNICLNLTVSGQLVTP